MVDCFFAFQDTKDSPKKTKKSVMNILELVKAPQSESKKAFNYNVDENEKKIPCPGSFFRYLNR